MTDRKPPNMSTGDWIEALIHRAEAEGTFDHIDRAPDPMAGVDVDAPDDENWWLRKWLQREGLTVTPAGLELKREIAEVIGAVTRFRTEQALRARLVSLNQRIAEHNLVHSTPLIDIAQFDIEETIARWRSALR
jgi:hypothetical protein